ncbi:MAG: hypothetical protein FJW68_08380 [Actinobacteria bacterium]|nr:hypothetical protein [Actinomycetota bacterium]
MEVIPARVFNLLYVYIDIVWLVFFLAILIWKKKYMAAIAGAAGSLIYFLVDYGIFYLALGTRTVDGANTAALLLWLSISYGLTNFAWIWLWLDRDGHALEWSLLIISAWIATALLSQNFGANFQEIAIQRGTSSYHGVMALLLFTGYAILIISNLKNRARPEKRINIYWILAIGILVQFSWEAVLLITGIRATGIMPLIVNSLLETNMGLPFLFLIHRSIASRYSESLVKIRK